MESNGPYVLSVIVMMGFIFEMFLWRIHVDFLQFTCSILLIIFMKWCLSKLKCCVLLFISSLMYLLLGVPGYQNRVASILDRS